MSKFLSTILLSGLALSLVACTPKPQPTQDAYWQRIETHSALYLTGVKAQQQLDENISACVREVDELIRLKAIRETTPPDTHYEYHDALRESGDLAAFETPEHHKNLHVDHSEYYDFESCMRNQGWERVRAVRYQAAKQSRENYKDTQDIREYGVMGYAADLKRDAKRTATQSSDFNE